MVMEIGVDFARLENWMYDALNVIKDNVVDKGGTSAIVTLAYGRDDGKQTDVFKVILVEMEDKAETMLANQRIREQLGEKYDVRIEQGLIRVKYIFG